VSDWADRLVAYGHADAQMVAEAERVLQAASLQPGDTVLDVGAGLGLLTLAAHERIGDGWVIAVDPSVGALEELLRLAHDVGSNGIMYLVGDADVLPLPDDSVDAVILRSVFVHVRDVGGAAAELARVLRPGGRLSLHEPLSGDGTSLATAVDWSPLGELGERIRAESESSGAIGRARRLDPDELVAQLEAVGFTAVERSVEDASEEWLVTAESVEARLAGRGSPTAPSVREHWLAAFGADDLASIEVQLKSLAGTTVTLRRPQLFLSARRP
jgi:arsenite methyltransferase